MEKIKIAKNKLSVSSAGTVTLENQKLANALVQENKKVVTELGVKASEISITKDGKIRIANKTLAQRVKADLADASFVNIGCGLGC
jgi:phosphosulfolactate synthase (CoM biosynthesis protein A)